MDLAAILAELRKPGRTLHRPRQLDAYWVDSGVGSMWDNRYVSGTRLTRAQVRRLESDGVIVLVGEFRYALAEGR